MHESKISVPSLLELISYKILNSLPPSSDFCFNKYTVEFDRVAHETRQPSYYSSILPKYFASIFLNSERLIINGLDYGNLNSRVRWD